MFLSEVQSETLQGLVRQLKSRNETAALIVCDGDSTESWSYRRLSATVERLSTGLLAHGSKRGEPIAILAPNSPQWVATFLASINAGAVAMPIDERLDAGEIVRMLDMNQCRWLATTHRHADRLSLYLAERCVSIISLDEKEQSNQKTLGWDDVLTDEALSAPEANAEDIAAILHTSGTTGMPKAVPLTHANFMSNIRGLAAERLVKAGDRALLPLPLHHVYALTVGLLTPLAAGAVVIFPAGISGPEFVAALQKGEITHLVGVPRLYTALLGAVWGQINRFGVWRRSLFEGALLLSKYIGRILHLRVGRIFFRRLHKQFAPQLRLLVCGGAALDAESAWQLEGLGWEVLSGYGLTETSPIVTFNRRSKKRLGTVGRPLTGVEVRVAQLGTDGLGEIQARGVSVFKGYRNDSAATAAAFTTDGWFRTGDLGFTDDDGYLHIVARLTETIVLPSGKKIFPETVEAEYAASSVIREIAVLPHLGTLTGLVVPNIDAIRDRGAVRAEDLLREELAAIGARLLPHERLSGFAVAHEPLPRTQLGKLRRHLLPNLYDQALHRNATPVVPELSDEDRKLLDSPVAKRVWAWLQKRFPDRRLSLDASPQLDLGIDSLGWVDFSLDMQSTLGLSITEASIARVVTLRDLIREAVAATVNPAKDVIRAPTIKNLESESRNIMLEICRRLLAGVNFMVIHGLFRLRVSGLENLPRQGPCLICPNHTSYLDPFVLAAALPYHLLRTTWWAGWTGILFAGRLQRAFSRVAQVIPIDPDRQVTSSLYWGGVALDRGLFLIWFPEGVRSYDGTLQRFMPGIGSLLQQRAMPVVPVYISGTFAAWPRTHRFPHFNPVSVAFGKPIDSSALLAGMANADPEHVAAAIRARVADLNQSIT